MKLWRWIFMLAVICGLAFSSPASADEGAGGIKSRPDGMKISHTIIVDASGSMFSGKSAIGKEGGGYGTFPKGYVREVGDYFARILQEDKRYHWIKPTDKVRIMHAVSGGTVEGKPYQYKPVSNLTVANFRKAFADPKRVPGPVADGGWGAGLGGYIVKAVDPADSGVQFIWLLTDNGCDSPFNRSEYEVLRDNGNFSHLWFSILSKGLLPKKKSPLALYLVGRNLANGASGTDWVDSFISVVGGRVAPGSTLFPFRPLKAEKQGKDSFLASISEIRVADSDSPSSDSWSPAVGGGKEYEVTPFVHQEGDNGDPQEAINVKVCVSRHGLAFDNAQDVKCLWRDENEKDYHSLDVADVSAEDGTLVCPAYVLIPKRHAGTTSKICLKISGKTGVTFERSRTGPDSEELSKVANLRKIEEFLFGGGETHVVDFETDEVTITLTPWKEPESYFGYVVAALGALVLVAGGWLLFTLLNRRDEYNFVYHVVNVGDSNSMADEQEKSTLLQFSRSRATLPLFVGTEEIGKVTLMAGERFAFAPSYQEADDDVPLAADFELGTAQSSPLKDGNKAHWRIDRLQPVAGGGQSTPSSRGSDSSDSSSSTEDTFW